MQFQGRDRSRTLKDLAKLAGPPPPKKRPPGMASSESSGFIDLAAIEAADPAWLEKAIARAKAPSVRFESDEDVDLGDLELPIRSRKRGLVVALVMCVAAAGAAGFVLRGRIRAMVSPSAVAALPITALPITAGQTAAPAQTAAPVIPPIPAIPPVPPEPSANASDAPDPAAAVASRADAKDGKKHHGHGAGTRGKSATHASGPSGPSSLAAKLAAPSGPSLPPSPPAPAGGGALGDAIKSAAAADPSPAPPPKSAEPSAAPVSGSVPDRPSPAVVTTTLKSVLPAARGCLAADDAPARATVTFGSNGAVSSVQITGAAGPPVTCIKTALGKAKVPAFAQPTYTATVSVRPN